MILESCLMMSHDKLNTLHRLAQGQWPSNIKRRWLSVTHKFEKPLDEVSCDVRWQIHYVFPCRRSMEGKALICHERLPCLKPEDLWASGQSEFTWQFEKYKSQDLWPLNLTGCWIWEGGSTRKRLSRHQILVLIKAKEKYFFIVKN